MKNTLSLCMIVKDEEKYIEKCLNSVHSIVDEIIIVDTGSSDSTIELAGNFKSKIYSYQWDNNFSRARNFSLKKATCNWILVLDADEAVHADDIHILKNKIQTTKANALSSIFHNYIDEDSDENFTLHTGLRLFKNGIFHYEGAIHEQLVPINKNVKLNIEMTNVRIHHFGYSNISQKKKHGRNIPIIQKLLDKNPNDAFQLFNMGNEYMCQIDYIKALSYFEKSYENKDITQAYCPHLLYRRAVCLMHLNKNEESLQAISEGLKYYPACTDFEYLRGIIYKLSKRYTLAIDSFNQCLKMGPAPQDLSFINNAATLRPLMELGSIYFLNDDWDKSLDHYVRALKHNDKRYDIVYKIGKILNKMLPDKTEVGKNLEKLFANSIYIPNLLVIVDILIDEGLYNEATTYFEKIENSEDYIGDKNYLKGRLYFYNKEYEAAYQKFSEVIKNMPYQSIISSSASKSYEYLVVCCLICQKNSDDCQTLILQKHPNSEEKQVLLYFIKETDYTFNKSVSVKIFSILSEILKTCEFELLEQKLPILNKIDSNTVLLDLANIYYINCYKDMAIKTILNSVKEFGLINAEAVYILNKEFSL